MTAACNSLLPSPRSWLSLGLAQGLCSPSKLEHHIPCCGFPASDPQHFPHNYTPGKSPSLGTEPSLGGGGRISVNSPISGLPPLCFSFLPIYNFLCHREGRLQWKCKDNFFHFLKNSLIVAPISQQKAINGPCSQALKNISEAWGSKRIVSEEKLADIYYFEI